MEISKTAEAKIKAKIKKLEESIADTHKDIGFHGNDQDGWHGEAYQLSMIEFFTSESKLNDLKRVIQKSEVVAPNDDGMVSVGKKVTVEIDGSEKEFIFDGIAYENNVITPQSPIGKALMLKKEGQELEYQVGSKIYTGRVLSVKI